MELIKKIKKLRFGVIDSSSIIYMEKSGFLDRAAKVVVFYTPPEVFKEIGYSVPGIEVLSHDKTGAVDSILIALAAEKNIPLISEDRKLLLRAGNKNLPYYNAIMILNVLLAKGAVSLEDHSVYFGKIVEIARYSAKVLEFSRAVYNAIVEMKKGKPEKLNGG